MPMAISFVGASVIFKLIYDARPADTGADRCAQCALDAASTADSGQCSCCKACPRSSFSPSPPSAYITLVFAGRFSGAVIAGRTPVPLLVGSLGLAGAWLVC
jgi:hypothetical protein